MLCALVFIFTSDSSALLGRPCCGLSIWLSLLVIYTFLSLCQFFSREKGQNTKILEACHCAWHENGHRRLFGAQSINAERASQASKYFDINFRACYTFYLYFRWTSIVFGVCSWSKRPIDVNSWHADLVLQATWKWSSWRLIRESRTARMSALFWQIFTCTSTKCRRKSIWRYCLINAKRLN